MQLTEHFTLEEMIASQVAAREGWKNYPAPDILENLKKTCEYMETVRAILGFPIHVTSGYRSRMLNAEIGGATQSAHCLGWAVDFICPQFGDPLAVATKLSETLKDFDQIIHEFATWTHVSFDPRMRRELLTIKHDGEGYKPGLLP